jgi:putative chitinase
MGDVLKLNSSGPEVLALQKALEKAGFNPGAINSSFSESTQAAVVAFQRSKGLAADGIVGPITAAALGIAAIPESVSAIPAVTVQMVSQMFPLTPLVNIAANLPPVLNALAAATLSDKQMILMALSTIRAETEGFVPISEGQSRFNTSPGGTPFNLYDNRKDLGNQGAPDGANFRGRGFVQLTGRANYTRYGAAIEKDLIANPDLANEPEIAAQLLATFLSDRQDRIRAALAQNNLKAARKLVNGGSNGLDRFTNAFNIGMRLIV